MEPKAACLGSAIHNYWQREQTHSVENSLTVRVSSYQKNNKKNRKKTNHCNSRHIFYTMRRLNERWDKLNILQFTNLHIYRKFEDRLRALLFFNKRFLTIFFH